MATFGHVHDWKFDRFYTLGWMRHSWLTHVVGLVQILAVDGPQTLHGFDPRATNQNWWDRSEGRIWRSCARSRFLVQFLREPFLQMYNQFENTLVSVCFFSRDWCRFSVYVLSSGVTSYATRHGFPAALCTCILWTGMDWGFLPQNAMLCWMKS